MSSGITFAGLGSGLDTKSIVEQLMAIESRHLAKLQAKKTAKSQALTVYSDLRTKLNELRSMAGAMNSSREFKKISAFSSDEDIFTVSATSSATPGNHTIKVTQLALAEMEVSQGYADTSSVVGTGTMSITVGTGAPIDIDIDSDHNSLSGMMDAINGSEADVTASIMNDGDPANPYRLVVTSNETGTASALTIDVSGLSGGTAPTFTDGAGGNPGQQAADATMVFDGVEVTKSSNEVDDLLTGVTINLLEVDDTTTYNLSIESDLEGIQETVTEFVEKYNEIYDYLKTNSSSSGLNRDYTISSFRRELTSIVTGSVEGASGNFTSLSQIGIATDASGHLQIDSEDFTDALEDHFDDVMQVFAAYGTTTNPYITYHNAGSDTKAGTYDIVITGVGENFAATINGVEADVSSSGNLIFGPDGTDMEGLMLEFTGTTTGSYGSVTVSIGVMEELDRKLDLYTSVSDGLIKSKEESINSSIQDLEDEMIKESMSLDLIEARLNSKFVKMEQMLSQLQTQGSFLSSMGTSSLF